MQNATIDEINKQIRELEILKSKKCQHLEASFSTDSSQNVLLIYCKDCRLGVNLTGTVLKKFLAKALTD